METENGTKKTENGNKKYLLIVTGLFIGVVIFVTNNVGPRIVQIPSPVSSQTVNVNIVQIEQPNSKKQKPTNQIKQLHFICPLFSGRLGNKLFLYASSFAIAKSKGMKVVLNSKCELARFFKLTADIRSDTSFCSSKNVKVIKEGHSAVFDKKLTEFENTSNMRLMTYLQSYLYFDKYSKEIREEFTFKEEINSEATKVIEGLLQVYNISRSHTQGKGVYQKNIYQQKIDMKTKRKVTLIAVQIRRGDMIVEQRVGRAVATKEYLHKAVDWYQNKYPDLIFIVASDGLQWAKDNMPKGITVIYLEKNAPWIDLAILAMCEHSITTVGTFSWWAGWLAGGNVIYYKWPAIDGTRQRLSYSKDYKDFFYPQWIGF